MICLLLSAAERHCEEGTLGQCIYQGFSFVIDALCFFCASIQSVEPRGVFMSGSFTYTLRCEHRHWAEHQNEKKESQSGACVSTATELSTSIKEAEQEFVRVYYVPEVVSEQNIST